MRVSRLSFPLTSPNTDASPGRAYINMLNGTPVLITETETKHIRLDETIYLNQIPSNVNVPKYIGQPAIVTHSDDSISEWSAVSESPIKWLLRTSGIIFNRDLNQWERLFIVNSIVQTEIIT